MKTIIHKNFSFLESKLRVERISVDASYLYCSTCGVNVPTNNIIS